MLSINDFYRSFKLQLYSANMLGEKTNCPKMGYLVGFFLNVCIIKNRHALQLLLNARGKSTIVTSLALSFSTPAATAFAVHFSLPSSVTLCVCACASGRAAHNLKHFNENVKFNAHNNLTK